jgi:hypothetical protein
MFNVHCTMVHSGCEHQHYNTRKFILARLFVFPLSTKYKRCILYSLIWSTDRIKGKKIIQPTSPKIHNVVFSLECLLMDLYSLGAVNYDSQKYIACDKSKLIYYTDLEQCIFFTYSVGWGSKKVLLHNREFGNTCITLCCITEENKLRLVRTSQKHETDLFTSTGPVHFVSCRLYPFFPQPSRRWLGPTCHLSLLDKLVE